MNLFSRKKLTAALAAGCSIIAINAVSLAAEAPEAAPAPAAHQEMAADFDKATLPADPGKALYEKHLHHMQSDYSWMTPDTAKRAAMAFTAMDKAETAGKIDAQQKTALQKAVISFYKENQFYANQYAKLSGDEAKAYRTDFGQYLQLAQNTAKIAKDSGVDEATVAEIFRHPGPKMQPGSRDQRAAAFLGQLVKQQKLTSAEANSMIAFMNEAHENYAKMDDAQRKAYKEKISAMTDEQRYAEMAAKTGISADRLKEIFTIIRDEIKAQAAAQTQPAAK